MRNSLGICGKSGRRCGCEAFSTRFWYLDEQDELYIFIYTMFIMDWMLYKERIYVSRKHSLTSYIAFSEIRIYNLGNIPAFNVILCTRV